MGGMTESAGLLRKVLLLLLVAMIAVGCASSRSGKAYSRDEARRVQSVQSGTVLAVQKVVIEGTKTPVGAAAGAVIGGVAGRGAGDTTGDRVRGAAGAVVGGVVGAAAEEGLTRRAGLEITVRLDNGETISVVQEADQKFSVNDRVRVLTQPNGTTRITP